MAKEGKGVKINTTTQPSDGEVLKYTLKGMEEWDMNKINDVGGSHNEINGPSTLGGK